MMAAPNLKKTLRLGTAAAAVYLAFVGYQIIQINDNYVFKWTTKGAVYTDSYYIDIACSSIPDYDSLSPLDLPSCREGDYVTAYDPTIWQWRFADRGPEPIIHHYVFVDAALALVIMIGSMMLQVKVWLKQQSLS